LASAAGVARLVGFPMPDLSGVLKSIHIGTPGGDFGRACEAISEQVEDAVRENAEALLEKAEDFQEGEAGASATQEIKLAYEHLQSVVDSQIFPALKKANPSFTSVGDVTFANLHRLVKRDGDVFFVCEAHKAAYHSGLARR
jgi:hypothetical protein